MITWDNNSCLYETEDYVVRLDSDKQEYQVHNKRTGVTELEARVLVEAIYNANVMQLNTDAIQQKESSDGDEKPRLLN